MTLYIFRKSFANVRHRTAVAATGDACISSGTTRKRRVHGRDETPTFVPSPQSLLLSSIFRFFFSKHPLTNKPSIWIIDEAQRTTIKFHMNQSYRQTHQQWLEFVYKFAFQIECSSKDLILSSQFASPYL